MPVWIETALLATGTIVWALIGLVMLAAGLRLLLRLLNLLLRRRGMAAMWRADRGEPYYRGYRIRVITAHGPLLATGVYWIANPDTPGPGGVERSVRLLLIGRGAFGITFGHVRTDRYEGEPTLRPDVDEDLIAASAPRALRKPTPASEQEADR